MSTPSDVEHLKGISWVRSRGHEWSTLSFRSLVVAWMKTFMSDHGWVRTMSAEERFMDNGVNRKQPYGPTHLTTAPRTLEEGFLQSDGLPILRLSATRDADARVFEVSVPFKKASLTEPSVVTLNLTLAAQSLVAVEAMHPA